MADAAWTLSDVCFRHPRAAVDAVAHITASLGHVGLTAIVGPNGAGKSTLAHLLAGLLTPTHGLITLHDRNVSSWRRVEMARTVGFVSQREEGVFPVTARQLVAMGRMPYLGPWRSAERVDDERVTQALADVGATQFVDRMVQTLSGGEHQRVRVARALAQDAALLLLDEPTASLDVRYEVELFHLLRTLADAGVRVVVITHNLSLAAQLADTVLLMARGAALAIGSPADVLTTDALSDAYEWPVDVVAIRTAQHGVVPMIVPRLPGRT